MPTPLENQKLNFEGIATKEIPNIQKPLSARGPPPKYTRDLPLQIPDITKPAIPKTTNPASVKSHVVQPQKPPTELHDKEEPSSKKAGPLKTNRTSTPVLTASHTPKIKEMKENVNSTNTNQTVQHQPLAKKVKRFFVRKFGRKRMKRFQSQSLNKKL